MNCPYKRLNLEWRPLSGFEQEYEISNYGDVHILEKEMTDSRGHSYHREEQYKSMNCSPSVIRNVAFHKGYHKTAKGYVWIRKDSYDPKKDYAVHYKQNKHYD